MKMGSEQIITYPKQWEDEYRDTRFVALWRQHYPELFADYRGSANPGTLDLFPQYALMFVLRSDHGIHSLTWYKLAGEKDLSTVREDVHKRWETMSRWMGQPTFDALQSTLRKAGLRGFKGEPDLFCWHPDTGKWFFAEAKKKDSLTESERQWHEICRKALGENAEIRVYRLAPSP